MFDLQRDGDVHVLRFDSGENRFSPEFIDGFHSALDTVEQAGGDGRALVTVGTGKFYSNGLDLDWLGEHSGEFASYLKRVHSLFTRLLDFPGTTIAAVNGHAFAGGAMLLLAHDFAVMRSDRGYFCLPEVDLGMSFTPGMSALVQSRLTVATAHEAMITGRRYTAAEAVAAGFARAAVPEQEVLPTALEIAVGQAAKSGKVVARIRRGMYGPVLAALDGAVF